MSQAPTRTRTGAARMRFSVEGWDPSYGSSVELEDDLSESSATTKLNVELAEEKWRPIEPGPGIGPPAAVLFIDGVRRVEARVWIDDETPDMGAPADATAAVCASYAAGVVCCCPQRGAHLLTVEARRGLFTVAQHAVDVPTSAGTYHACHVRPHQGTPLSVTLSQALQRRLADLEVIAAVQARDALSDHMGPGDLDLLVVDGPLRGRTHLSRALGFIKTHRSTYLPPQLNALVGTLPAGWRTPVFRMGTSWERHSWYLRLPCPPGAPWAGVVRVECSADLPTPAVSALANLSQVTLPRYASVEYKDARAPQNLCPIAGLERELRRRLGDPRLLYRALRRSAAS